jgi:hypothetical protein
MFSAKITSRVLSYIFWTLETLMSASNALSSMSDTPYEKLSFLADFWHMRWQRLLKFSISVNIITSLPSYDLLWSRIRSREVLPSTIDLIAFCDLSLVSISAIFMETGSLSFLNKAFSTLFLLDSVNGDDYIMFKFNVLTASILMFYVP